MGKALADNLIKEIQTTRGATRKKNFEGWIIEFRVAKTNFLRKVWGSVRKHISIFLGDEKLIENCWIQIKWIWIKLNSNKIANFEKFCFLERKWNYFHYINHLMWTENNFYWESVLLNGKRDQLGYVLYEYYFQEFKIKLFSN